MALIPLHGAMETLFYESAADVFHGLGITIALPGALGIHSSGTNSVRLKHNVGPSNLPTTALLTISRYRPACPTVTRKKPFFIIGLPALLENSNPHRCIN